MGNSPKYSPPPTVAEKIHILILKLWESATELSSLKSFHCTIEIVLFLIGHWDTVLLPLFSDTIHGLLLLFILCLHNKVSRSIDLVLFLIGHWDTVFLLLSLLCLAFSFHSLLVHQILRFSDTIQGLLGHPVCRYAGMQDC